MNARNLPTVDEPERILRDRRHDEQRLHEHDTWERIERLQEHAPAATPLRGITLEELAAC